METTRMALFLLLAALAGPDRLGAQAIALDPAGMTIESRIGLPDGFQRIGLPTGSFGAYLRALPLKPHGSLVQYFDGSAKTSPGVYVAVVDLPIGTKDLHQCADAVMRLRADYLFARKAFGKIHFNFLSDGKPRYWLDYAKGDNSPARFWRYLEHVFANANTRSLLAELNPVTPFTAMRNGDVLIQLGNPYGHAAIVVDMARRPASGETIYLLAQSYMPAQELQVLRNPADPELSPWYRLDTRARDIRTPEWLFQAGDLRRFGD